MDILAKGELCVVCMANQQNMKNQIKLVLAVHNKI